MKFNELMLARRLKKARENRNLSQQSVAEALALPRTAITQIEAGKRSVSTLELAKLAALYGRDVAEFFQEEEVFDDEDLVLTLHRTHPNFKHDEEMYSQVRHCLDLCEEGYWLAGLLGLAGHNYPPTYPMPTPRSTSEAVFQGGKVANLERQRLGLGTTPVADMADLISSQGIWASGILVKKSSEMSGLFMRSKKIGMVILVNFSHVRARKRFSYAHEYAHVLMDRDRTVTVSEKSNAADLTEKRANAFAAAFLMPRDGVLELLRSFDKGQPSKQEEYVFNVATEGRIDAQFRPTAGSQTLTYNNVALIAHHFGVSYQAATYRLKSLNVISTKQADVLLQLESAGKEFLRVLDMLNDLDAEESKERRDREIKCQIMNLALEAFRREEISKGRFFDVCRKVGVRDVVALAEAIEQEGFFSV